MGLRDGQHVVELAAGERGAQCRVVAVDLVVGGPAGGGDYVVKPFDVEEAFMRPRALLRRSSPENGVASTVAETDLCEAPGCPEFLTVDVVCGRCATGPPPMTDSAWGCGKSSAWWTPPWYPSRPTT